METAKLIEGVMFWAFSAVAVVAALGVVFHRSILYATLLLMGVFLAIAGLFLLNNADFLAIAQVLIYAVGLTIIILFAIMFTGDRHFGYDPKVISGTTMAGFAIVGLYLLAILTRSVWYPFEPTGAWFSESAFAAAPLLGSTTEIGRLIFTRYVLPFELVAMLLLMAMVGAIVLAKRELGTTAGPSAKYTVSPLTTPTEAAIKARQAHWEAYRHKDPGETTGAEAADQAGNEDKDDEAQELAGGVNN